MYNHISEPNPTPERQQLIGHLENIADSLGYEQRVRSLHKSLLSSLKNTWGTYDAIDPVTKCVLADLQGSEVSYDLQFIAVATLCDKLEDYQAVFGDLIPTWLKNTVLQKRSATAFDQGTNQNLRDDLGEYLRRLERSESRGVFPTGLYSVDDAMCGGIHGLTVLLGDKGVGKTAFAVNCIVNALQQDPTVAVLIYALDLSKRRIMDRLASCHLGVSTAELNKDSVRHRIASEIDESFWHRIRVRERDFRWERDHSGEDAARRGLTSQMIIQDATMLLRQPGVRRVLVIIDLFQKTVLPSTVQPSDADQYRLDAIDESAQTLRRLGGDDCVGFLVISEMRKREATRKKEIPTKDDIKGDGRIPSDADNVLILAPSKEISSDESELILRIDKGRDGVTRGDHRLRFLHRMNRFSGDNSPCSAAHQDNVTDPGNDPFE